MCKDGVKSIVEKNFLNKEQVHVGMEPPKKQLSKMGTFTHLCFCGNRKIVSVMEECLPLSIVTSCTPWLSKNTEAQSIVQAEKEVSFHYRHLRNIIVKCLQQAKIKALFFFHHKSYKKFGNCTGQ